MKVQDPLRQMVLLVWTMPGLGSSLLACLRWAAVADCSCSGRHYRGMRTGCSYFAKVMDRDEVLTFGATWSSETGYLVVWTT